MGTRGRCESCDLSVTVRAEPLAATDGCPEDLIKGRLRREGRRVGGEFNVFETRYDIERGADGAATLYFADSGKRLGSGRVTGDEVTWISNHQCKWF